MLPMVTNARKRKILFARTPHWARFLPDVHNGRCCLGVMMPLLRLHERRENQWQNRTCENTDVAIAQNFGTRLWTSCTRLKTNEIKSRQNS